MYIDPSEVEVYPRPRRILSNIATGVGIVLGTFFIVFFVAEVTGTEDQLITFIGDTIHAVFYGG